MKIRMLNVDKNKILNYGFTNSGDGWYSKVIPQTFRGEYTLYISHDDIYGTFQGISIQEWNLDRFIDKLAYRTPDAAEELKKLLFQMKMDGAISYEEIQ